MSNEVNIWGLGIGDWAIPNPQSPIPTKYILYTLYKLYQLLI